MPIETPRKNNENMETTEILSNIKSHLDSLKREVESNSFDNSSKNFENIVDFLDRLDFIEWVDQVRKEIDSKQEVQQSDIDKIDSLLNWLSEEQINQLDTSKMQESYEVLSWTSSELDNLHSDIKSHKQELEKSIYDEVDDLWWFGGMIISKDMIDETISYIKSTSTEESSKNDWILSQVNWIVDKAKFWINMTLLSFVAPSVKGKIDQYKEIIGWDIPDEVPSDVDVWKEELSRQSEKFDEEKIEKLKEDFKDKTKEQLEQEFWVDMDDERFQRAFDRWYEDNDMKEHFQGKHDRFRKALDVEGDESFNFLLEPLATFWFLSKAWFDLILKLREEDLISFRDIWLSVVEKSWKMVVEYWTNALGLVTNGMNTVFGRMELDEFVDFVENRFEKFSGMEWASREAILWLLYRHWWIMHSILRNMGNVFGQLITAPIQVWDDIGRISNFWWHLFNSLERQINAWERLAWAYWDAGSALSWDWSLTRSFNEIQDNVRLYHSLSGASNYQDFIQRANTAGISNVDVVLRNMGFDDLPSPDDFTNYKRRLGTHLGWKFRSFGQQVQGTYWSFLGNVQARVPWTVKNEARRLWQHLQRYWELSEQIIDNDSVLYRLRRWMARWQRATLSMDMTDLNNSARFYLNSMDNIEDFTRDLRHIARSAPEMLGHFAWNIPLIVLWWELLNKLQDPETEGFSEIAKTIGYIFPFVWPALLVWEWFEFENWEFKSWGMAGTGVLLTGLDSYFVMRGVPRYGFLGSVWRQFIMPATQAWRFVSSLPRAGYDLYHFSKKSGKMVAQQWIRWMTREFLSTSAGRRLLTRWGLFWLIAVWGYMGIKNYFLDDDGNLIQEVKENLDDPEKLDEILQNPSKLDDVLDEMWDDMNKEEKEQAIKFAIIFRLWKDLTQIENESFNSFKVELIEKDWKKSFNYNLPYSWFGYEEEEESEEINKAINESVAVSDHIDDIQAYIESRS